MEDSSHPPLQVGSVSKGTGVFFPGSMLATVAAPAQNHQHQHGAQQTETAVPTKGSSGGSHSMPKQSTGAARAPVRTAALQQLQQHGSHRRESSPVSIKSHSRPGSCDRHQPANLGSSNSSSASTSSNSSRRTTVNTVSPFAVASSIQQAASPPPPPPPPTAAPTIPTAAAAAAAAAANASSRRQQQQPPPVLTRHLSLIRGNGPMEPLSPIVSASDLGTSEGLVLSSGSSTSKGLVITHLGVDNTSVSPPGSQLSGKRMVTKPYVQDLVATQMSDLRISSSSSSLSRASSGALVNRYPSSSGSSSSSSSSSLPLGISRTQSMLVPSNNMDLPTAAAPLRLVTLGGITMQTAEQQQQQLLLQDIPGQQLLIVGSPIQQVQGQWPTLTAAAAAATPPGASPTYTAAAAAASNNSQWSFDYVSSCQPQMTMQAADDQSLPLSDFLQPHIGNSSFSSNNIDRSSISCPLPLLQQQQLHQQQQQELEQQIAEKQMQLQLLLQLKQQSYRSTSTTVAAAATSAAAATAYAPLMHSNSGTSLMSYAQPVTAAAAGSSSSSLVNFQQQQQQPWSAQAAFPDVLRHSLDLPAAAAAAMPHALSLDLSNSNLLLLDSSQSAAVVGGSSSSSMMAGDYSLAMHLATMQQPTVMQQQVALQQPGAMHQSVALQQQQMPSAQQQQQQQQQQFDAKLQQLLTIRQQEVQLQNELLQMLPDF